MKLLKQLYEIHSPSGQEKRLRTFIETYIRLNIKEAYFSSDKMGNLFITKGKAETYPCVVAHLDQVQRLHSKGFRAVETKEIIFGYSASKRRREGLGADDKNGIWIALQCLKKYDAIKIAFFMGEEIGCVGSNAADLTFFQDCRFVIEPDRRGHSDVITQISGLPVCSEEFATEIQPELFGYNQEYGMMTDIEILRENGLALSCINVSCGYYEPHTDDEFTVKKDLLNCLKFVQHIIENCTEVYAHQMNLDHSNNYHGWVRPSVGDSYDHYLDQVMDIVVANPDYTVDDAWDVYCVNFPELSQDEFEELFADCKTICEDDTIFPEPLKPPVLKSKKSSKKKKKRSTVTSSTRSYTFFGKSREELDTAGRLK